MPILSDQEVLERVANLRKCAATVRKYALRPVVTPDNFHSMTGERGLAAIKEKRFRLGIVDMMDETTAKLDKIEAETRKGDAT